MSDGFQVGHIPPLGNNPKNRLGRFYITNDRLKWLIGRTENDWHDQRRSRVARARLRKMSRGGL